MSRRRASGARTVTLPRLVEARRASFEAASPLGKGFEPEGPAGRDWRALSRRPHGESTWRSFGRHAYAYRLRSSAHRSAEPAGKVQLVWRAAATRDIPMFAFDSKQTFGPRLPAERSS